MKNFDLAVKIKACNGVGITGGYMYLNLNQSLASVRRTAKAFGMGATVAVESCRDGAGICDDEMRGAYKLTTLCALTAAVRKHGQTAINLATEILQIDGDRLCEGGIKVVLQMLKDGPAFIAENEFQAYHLAGEPSMRKKRCLIAKNKDGTVSVFNTPLDLLFAYDSRK